MVRADGKEVAALRVKPTLPGRGPSAVVRDVVGMAKESTNEVIRQGGKAPLGIGIGCPGPLDRNSGTVIVTPNLGWRHYPVREEVAGALRLPASLDNDANCATYGEWWRGAARGADPVVGVTLGTGVGGGLILGGNLLRGVSGAAGAIGHTIVDMDGRRCGCGSRGCLEAYASGPAIVAQARERLQNRCGGSLLAELDEFTAEQVFDAAAKGDRLAEEVVRNTARALGAGMAGLVNLLNPEVIVVLGGVAGSGNLLIDPVRAEVVRRSFKVAHGSCRIALGELGMAAGVVGAAGIFLADRNEHADKP